MADAHFPLEDYFDFDIRSFAVPVQFESGDIILSEGEANDALFFLERGRVKVSVTVPCAAAEINLSSATMPFPAWS